MKLTYGTWLAILWWIFTAITIFGLMLQQLAPPIAVTTIGCSGLVFIAFAALMHLRDRP